MNFDKYVICRATVSILLIGLVVGLMWEFGASIDAIAVLIILGIGFLWFLAFLPVIFTNLAWCSLINNKETWIVWFGLGLLTTCIELLGVGIAATDSNEPNYTIGYALNHAYTPLWWLPLIILALNLLFILVYYTVGKRTCKLIYGAKKELGDE